MEADQIADLLRHELDSCSAIFVGATA
jgi:hypothetical protein